MRREREGGRGNGSFPVAESNESASVENREVFKIKVRSPHTPSACGGDRDERVLFCYTIVMAKSFWITTLIIIALLGWGSVNLMGKNKTVGPDLSTFYPAQNRNHIAVGTPHGEYNSNPPSGGWHYELTAKKKFYEEPILDEYALHNLEHGDVWITYHPRVSSEVKEALKKFAFAKVFITPREGNDMDIALVAWERVDKFNLDGAGLPEDRINDFINRYRNKGPERIPAGAIESTFN